MMPSNTWMHCLKRPNRKIYWALVVPYSQRNLEHGNQTQHKPMEKRFQELLALRTTQPKRHSNFTWANFYYSTDRTLDNKARYSIREFFLQILDTFARHRLDIGINNDLEVELARLDERPAYNQNLPVNSKEDVTVDCALLHNYCIVFTLPFD